MVRVSRAPWGRGHLLQAQEQIPVLAIHAVWPRYGSACQLCFLCAKQKPTVKEIQIVI
jgi:hypothetical protein